MKIDMHIHTKYSHDATITAKELALYAKRQKLDGVTITDHNTTKGAKEFGEIKDLLIIPGIEIAAEEGHVLGVAVETPVKSGLSFDETVERIHEAGGLAIVAHPTAFLKGIPAEELIEDFDAMEVINSSAIPFNRSVNRNRKLAVKLKLPQTGGSDAHCAGEIGMAYTIFETDSGIEGILKALERGAATPYGKGIPWDVRLKREFISLKKRWIGTT